MDRCYESNMKEQPSDAVDNLAEMIIKETVNPAPILACQQLQADALASAIRAAIDEMVAAKLISHCRACYARNVEPLFERVEALEKQRDAAEKFAEMIEKDVACGQVGNVDDLAAALRAAIDGRLDEFAKGCICDNLDRRVERMEKRLSDVRKT